MVSMNRSTCHEPAPDGNTRTHSSPRRQKKAASVRTRNTQALGKSDHILQKEKPRLLAEPGSLNNQFVEPSATGQRVLALALVLVLVLVLALREQARLVALEQVQVQRRQEH